jgi:hypothetical protein
MWARRRRTFSFVLLLLPFALVSTGCRNTNQELLESELRARERDVRELREELGRLECYNEALQREAACTHQQGAVGVSPEFAAQTFTLRKITLGRGTGGVDEDHKPGDEALLVVLEPRDADNHIIKAPGAVHVTAMDINSEGVKTPLSNWDVSPEQLRRSWRAGLFSTGYFLTLPWNSCWPTSEQVRVLVRLQTADGRLFEVDRDVRVRLAAEPPHEKMPPGEVLPPAPPRPVEPLPPPRPVEVPTVPPPPPAPVTPADSGPPLPSVSHRVNIPADNDWHPLPLEGAVQLRRPVPLNP